MGLSNFPSPADGGVLPVLVMNTVISVALVKNMLRSMLQLIGLLSVSSENADEEFSSSGAPEGARSKRKISVVQFKLLFGSAGSGGKSSGGPIAEECSVCLCGFEGEEEVSELSCKHFFHKNCLEKWFLNRRSTCPLCRSEL